MMYGFVLKQGPREPLGTVAIVSSGLRKACVACPSAPWAHGYTGNSLLSCHHCSHGRFSWPLSPRMTVRPTKIRQSQIWCVNSLLFCPRILFLKSWNQWVEYFLIGLRFSWGIEHEPALHIAFFSISLWLGYLGRDSWFLLGICLQHRRAEFGDGLWDVSILRGTCPDNVRGSDLRGFHSMIRLCLWLSCFRNGGLAR